MRPARGVQYQHQVALREVARGADQYLTLRQRDEVLHGRMFPESPDWAVQPDNAVKVRCVHEPHASTLGTTHAICAARCALSVAACTIRVSMITVSDFSHASLRWTNARILSRTSSPAPEGRFLRERLAPLIHGA